MEDLLLYSPLIIFGVWTAYEVLLHRFATQVEEPDDRLTPEAVRRSSLPNVMTEELRRKMVQRRREDAERLKPLEGHAAPLFALVSDTESSKRIRAQALTDLTECEPDDAEPYLVAIFEGDDAYLRVKVVLFTLRKGYREVRYPILTAKRSEIIRAELLRGGRSVSTKRMLIKALTRYQRSDFEREALQALPTASGHLRREILAYLEALGTMVSVRAL